MLNHTNSLLPFGMQWEKKDTELDGACNCMKINTPIKAKMSALASSLIKSLSIS